MALGRREEALEALRTAVALAPAFAAARLDLARILGELGRRSEQRQALKEALALAPDSGEAHFLMGEVYLAEGDRAAAYAECQILHRLDRARARELLDRIYP